VKQQLMGLCYEFWWNFKQIIINFLYEHQRYINFKYFYVGNIALLKYPEIGKKRANFMIIPSYSCNQKCNHCLLKGLEEKHKEDMSLETFSKVLDWLEHNKLKIFRLMGGELLVHPKVTEYFDMITKRKFKIKFYTNLMAPEEKTKEIFDHLPPERTYAISITYRPIEDYSLKEHKLFLNNIYELSRRGYDIILRGVLIDTNTKYDHVIELAKKLKSQFPSNSITIKFIPAYPGATDKSSYTSIEECKRLIPNIIDMYEKCKKAGIKFNHHPTPHCFYDKKNKRYIHRIGRNPCLREGRSNFAPLVYPNLKVSWCDGFQVMAKKKLLQYNKWEEIYEELKDKFESCRWKVPLFPKCKTCKRFIKRTCQGRCAAFKLAVKNGKFIEEKCID